MTTQDVSIRCRNPKCKNWFLARVRAENVLGKVEIQTKCPKCGREEWRNVEFQKMAHPEVPARSARFKLKDGHWMFGCHEFKSVTEPVFEHIDELNTVARMDCANCAVVTLFGEAAFLSATPADIMKNRVLIEKYNVTIGEWLAWGGAK